MPADPAAADDVTPIRSATSLARRRAEGRRRMFLVSGIGGAVLVVAVVVGILLANGAGSRRLPKGAMDPTGVLPREDVEGEEWDYDQLTAYFQRCGIRVKRGKGSGIARIGYESGGQPVEVNAWSSARMAREQASVRPGSFAWGVFMFDGGPGELRAQMADVLGVRYP